MSAKRYSNKEIMEILDLHNSGVPARELIEKYGIANGTFYRWRLKYRLDNETRTLKDNNSGKSVTELSLENQRLKKLLADTLLEKIELEEKLEDASVS